MFGFAVINSIDNMKESPLGQSFLQIKISTDALEMQIVEVDGPDGQKGRTSNGWTNG